MKEREKEPKALVQLEVAHAGRVTVIAAVRPRLRRETSEFQSELSELATRRVVGRRPAHGIAERISRLVCGEFLKLHQWQITAN